MMALIDADRAELFSVGELCTRLYQRAFVLGLTKGVANGVQIEERLRAVAAEEEEGGLRGED